MSREFSLISTKLELEVCKNKKKVLAGNWCYQDNNKKNFLVIYLQIILEQPKRFS